jgi:ATP-dependent DNA helicase RecQ
LGEVRPELDLPARGSGRTPSSRRRERSVAAEPGPDDATVDPELFARLKEWRTDEARRRSLPPYVIFHDRTLAAVAAAKPAQTADLARIKGIGPAKLAAYGEALLRLMS